MTNKKWKLANGKSNPEQTTAQPILLRGRFVFLRK
jgi:hypothetical protein